MLNERNRTWILAPNGKASGYSHIVSTKQQKTSPAEVPALDWPADLYSRFTVEVTDDRD